MRPCGHCTHPRSLALVVHISYSVGPLFHVGLIYLHECPYMAVEAHNLIMDNYFGVVQYVLHHDPQKILPFGLHVRGSLQ